MTVTKQYSTFYLDGLLFGIELKRIQEVLGPQQITSIPLAPPAVLGLINLRGQIVTALDLRRRLGLRDRLPNQSSANIVLRSDDDVLSLLVDEVGEVVEVAEDTFELPPDTMASESRALTHGVHKLADGLMRILNVEQAINLPSKEEVVVIGDSDTPVVML